MALAACNDAPTDVGSSLVPGTDTLYALSSTDKALLDSMRTTSAYPVMYNGAYVLFGKTPDSEGRLFLEIIEYPNLGDSTKWEVLECALGMLPQPYTYGDSLDGSLGMRGYELTKEWQTQITWDSVWASDGSTSYYTEASTPVVDTSLTIATTDTIIYVNFKQDAARRWLVHGNDSAQVDNKVFGMVLLPTNSASIRQFRNADQNVQVMLLRVITKNVDKETPDTNYLKTAVAAFVNTPSPSPTTELLVQGARIHSVKMAIQLDSLPPFAIVVGASLTVYADVGRSQLGSGGLDELLELVYTDLTGKEWRYQTRVSDSSKYVFPNISAIVQRIQLDGKRGTLELRPTDAYDTWRMNRVAIHDSTTNPALAPRFIVVYTVPTVFQ